MKFAVALLLIMGQALGQNVKTFYATDLTLVPGLVEVSPGYPTTIELYDSVDAVLSGDNNETFLIEELGNQLVIKTASSGGDVGVQVVVRGRRLLFEVHVNVDDPKIRSYPVLQDRGRVYAPTAAEPAAATTVPAAPAQPVAATEPGGEALSLRPSGFDAKGSFTVFFRFQNGPDRLVLDPTRLTVSQDGKPLPVKVSKEPLSNLLAPHDVQNGLIRVDGATPGDLSLAWDVVTVTPDGGGVATLTEVVHAE